MGLLDDARRYLAETKEYCHGCGMELRVHPEHQPHCREKQRQAVMPRIVAALEAVERVRVDIGPGPFLDQDQPEISAETARAIISALNGDR